MTDQPTPVEDVNDDDVAEDDGLTAVQPTVDVTDDEVDEDDEQDEGS